MIAKFSFKRLSYIHQKFYLVRAVGGQTSDWGVVPPDTTLFAPAGGVIITMIHSEFGWIVKSRPMSTSELRQW